VGTAHVTYAEVLNSWLPTTHLSMLARMQIIDRQVLIDRDMTMDTNHLHCLTEWELVAKANEVLLHMVSQMSQSVGDTKAISTKRLCNSGIIYELNS